jgi:hypothetical protein
MASLDRTIALAKVHADAVPVAEHLHFDVPRLFHEFLEVEHRRTERALRFRLAHSVGARQLVTFTHDSHAAPAAARRRLDDDRIRHLLGERLGFLQAAKRRLAAWHHRCASLLGHGARLGLVTHQPDGLGRWANEDDAARATDLRERLILRQQAVAWMNRFAIGDGRRRDDARDVEVTLARLGRADADRLVRELHRQRIRIGRGMGDDRANAHVAARPENAERDLSPIGDQDLVKHGDARLLETRRRALPPFRTFPREFVAPAKPALEAEHRRVSVPARVMLSFSDTLLV